MKFNKQDIKSISHFSEFNKVSWQMTHWCNYRCEYCIQAHSYDNKLLSFDEYAKHADILNAAIEKSDKGCSLFLIGGEVTYINLVRLFKEHLNSKKIREMHITTNLSRDEKWWNEFYDYCNENNIIPNVSASLHITQVKDLNEFISKAKKFATVVSVVINNENYKLMENALENLKASGYDKKLFINIDRNNIKLNSTSKEIQELANKYSKQSDQFTVTLNDGSVFKMSKDEIQTALDGNMDFSGFKCSTWVRYKNDGIIYRGGCKWKLTECEGTDNINYEPVICKTKKCPLCTVINITKS